MNGSLHGSEKKRYMKHFLRGNKNNIDVKLCFKRLLLQARINKNMIALFIALAGLLLLSAPNPSYTLNASTSSFGFTPIVIGVYFKDGYIANMHRLPIHNPERYPSKRKVDWTDDDQEGQDLLEDEKYYDKHRREEPSDKSCELFDWQRQIKPTCNSIHETGLTDFFIENFETADERVRLIAHGFWRDVWKVRRDGTDSWSAFKTIRMEHDYTERNFDRHERDAIVMDSLTKSEHIVKMYSFCGHSTITEFTTNGSLSDLIWPPDDGMMAASMRERLDMAIQIAKAITDVHFLVDEDIATISHADISPSQFLFIDGIMKLVCIGFNMQETDFVVLVFNSFVVHIQNDFNRCRFIGHKRNGEQCPFFVSSNPGSVRFYFLYIIYIFS